MPDRSDKLLSKAEDAGEYELPYVSKSRVMQWIKNPEHFRLKYLEGVTEEETDAMVRGTRIHKTFEEWYEEAEILNPDGLLVSDWALDLPEDRQLWADFIEPYISNFFKFENRRVSAAEGDEEVWRPVAIEDERWEDDGLLGIEDEPPWMGIADVIYDADSVPGFPDGDGVVIVDFKTGSVPDQKYRDDGILLELAYYELLFQSEYNVLGTGAYYPKADDLLLRPTWTEEAAEQRDRVRAEAEDMMRQSRNYTGGSKFETKPGPLCGWSEDPEDRSSMYGICSQCTWNVPVDNKEQFKQLIKEGRSYTKIAELLGTTTDAVGYWKYKLDL